MRVAPVMGLLVVSLLGRQLPAQEVTGSIQGRVAMSDSAPAAGIRLSITGPNLQGVRASATDVRGYFQLHAIPPGEYELRLAHIGWATPCPPGAGPTAASSWTCCTSATRAAPRGWTKCTTRTWTTPSPTRSTCNPWRTSRRWERGSVSRSASDV
jgi:hypothetical protein